MTQTPLKRNQPPHLFPGSGAVGFPSTVHSSLVLPKVDECGSQAGKVGHVVVQELCCVVHSLLVTSVAHLERERDEVSHVQYCTVLCSTEVTAVVRALSYLLYVSIVGPADKLLQLCQTTRLGQGKDQLRLHVRLPRFLPRHLKEFHQVFPIICEIKKKNKDQHDDVNLYTVTCFIVDAVKKKKQLTVLAGCIYHLHVCRRVDSFYVGVNGLLDQVSLQLSSGQLAPNCRFITALCKLIGTVQVAYVLYQYLEVGRRNF